MDSTHVMNVTRGDFFDNLWVSCLFVPLAFFYTQVLLWIGSFTTILESIGFIKEVNEVLGYGLGTLILFGVQLASKYSRNDFIAGPIEQLNMYTFCFVGLFKAGIMLALLFTIMYLVLETYGLPLIVESISGNERIKSYSLGIQDKQFRLFQFVYSPISMLAALTVSFALINRFVSLNEIRTFVLYDQLKYLTLLIALWTLLETIANHFYNRRMPRLGCLGFFFYVAQLGAALRLSHDWTTWLWYGFLVIGGWNMIFLFITVSLRRSKDIAANQSVRHIDINRLG